MQSVFLITMDLELKISVSNSTYLSGDMSISTVSMIFPCFFIYSRWRNFGGDMASSRAFENI